MDERTVLRKAKGVLLERGWHQGAYCASLLGDTGAVCIEGAVRTTMFGGPYGRPTTRLEHVALGAVYRKLMEFTAPAPIPAWNDTLGRTIDEAVALLDRALGSLPAEAPELEKEPVHA